MSTLVYMKILERSPASYDRWMRFLTLGRIDRIKHKCADLIEAGDEVLEIGCGSGSLAYLMSEKGAKITAIDISEKMLVEARQKVAGASFYHLTALEIDQFDAERFDKVVATLSFSELTEDELVVVISMITKILKPGGRLIVADEVRAYSLFYRLFAKIVRLPLAIITFLVTQQTTHALVEFEGRLCSNNFQLLRRDDFLLNTMALWVAKKR